MQERLKRKYNTWDLINVIGILVGRRFVCTADKDRFKCIVQIQNETLHKVGCPTVLDLCHNSIDPTIANQQSIRFIKSA